MSQRFWTYKGVRPASTSVSTTLCPGAKGFTAKATLLMPKAGSLITTLLSASVPVLVTVKRYVASAPNFAMGAASTVLASIKGEPFRLTSFNKLICGSVVQSTMAGSSSLTNIPLLWPSPLTLANCMTSPEARQILSFFSESKAPFGTSTSIIQTSPGSSIPQVAGIFSALKPKSGASITTLTKFSVPVLVT